MAYTTNLKESYTEDADDLRPKHEIPASRSDSFPTQWQGNACITDSILYILHAYWILKLTN